jgi:beta-xylosidase
MKLSEINIRDPYIVADKSTDKYYMYSSSLFPLPKGFCVYVSEDLENWSEPASVFEATNDFWATDDFWAPEVHCYKEKYYLFGTFSSDKHVRTSQILVSDSLVGPFTIHSQPLAPDNWYALDATLFIEDGKPYAVFSHEWLQTDDGEMCYVQLSDDLKKPIGETKVLFRASESGWAKNPVWNKSQKPVYVVDAPFVCDIDGLKFMLWSSWSTENNDGYAVGVAYPKKDFLCGKFTHKVLNLPKKDSGHAMVFCDFNGDFRIALHENNSVCGMERAAIYYIDIKNGEVTVYEKKGNN